MVADQPLHIETMQTISIGESVDLLCVAPVGPSVHGCRSGASPWRRSLTRILYILFHADVVKYGRYRT